jgi:hypothetical protein
MGLLGRPGRGSHMLVCATFIALQRLDDGSSRATSAYQSAANSTDARIEHENHDVAFSVCGGVSGSVLDLRVDKRLECALTYN